MAVQISKLLVGAVLSPTTPGVDISKLIAGAVLWTGNPGISIGKLVAGAVIVEAPAGAYRPIVLCVT